MHTAFTIHIEFSTPVIPGRRYTVDGLLAHLLYLENRARGMTEPEAIDHAHQHVPLTSRDGIHAGSSALIPQCKTQPVTLIQSFKRHLTEAIRPEESIRPSESTRKNGRKFEGIGYPLMNRYDALTLDHGLYMSFLCKGDRSVIERLFSDVEYLGKKRSIGYGKLKGSPTFIDAEDHPLFGMMSRDGTVLRPIPQAVLDGFGTPPAHYALSFETARPPYWRTERVLCYVPPHRTWDCSALESLVTEG